MNKRILIIILFLLFIIPNTTLAARIPCTTKNLNNMKNEAYSVNLTYDFITDENNNHYFEIYISGLTQNLEARYENIFVSYDASNEKQLVATNDNGNVTLNIDIYGARGSACDGHKVLTRSVTLPKYNVYSEKEECIEYEEFRLCNKWCKEEIPNEAYFYDELNKYLDSISKEPSKPDENLKTNIFEKLINFYIDNIYISVPITIIFVIALGFIIVRRIIRKKNRIKIDI